MRSSLLAVVALPGVCITAPACGHGKQMPDEGQTHIDRGRSGKYTAAYPPTSGEHWGDTWAEWQMYDTPTPPEVFVHNLEHGGIVPLYRCDAPCPQLVDPLRKLYATFPKAKNGKVKMVVAPDPKIRSQITILAWTWIDELPRFDRERLLKFYTAHVDRGPEDVS